MNTRLTAACSFVVVLFAQIAVAAEGHGEGSPNLFAGNLGNAIWTLTIFVVLLFVLGKFAWGPMLAALQKRERFIRESLEQAAADRDEAARLLAEHAEKMKSVRAEAQGLIQQAHRDAEDARRKLLAEAQDEAKRLSEQARQDIGIAREQAVKDLYAETAHLATLAAGRIVGRELSPADHEELIRQSLSQLRSDGSKN